MGMRRGWGRRAHAVPMHDAGIGRADRATARRPQQARCGSALGRSHPWQERAPVSATPCSADSLGCPPRPALLWRRFKELASARRWATREAPRRARGVSAGRQARLLGRRSTRQAPRRGHRGPTCLRRRRRRGTAACRRGRGPCRLRARSRRARRCAAPCCPVSGSVKMTSPTVVSVGESKSPGTAYTVVIVSTGCTGPWRR